MQGINRLTLYPLKIR